MSDIEKGSTDAQRQQAFNGHTHAPVPVPRASTIANPATLYVFHVDSMPFVD